MPAHSRASSLAGLHFHRDRDRSASHTQSQSQSQPPQQPAPPKHQRTKTAPEAPALFRLFSSSSTSSRSRRTSNPSTPTAAKTASTATSPSYFSPPAASTEPRSPAARRPPASFSAHGIDNSRGPPVTLVTRGNSDIARRSSASQQKPADFAFAQQQLLQSGLVSPAAAAQPARRRDGSAHSSERAPHPQQTRTRSRNRSTSTSRPAAPRRMASSTEGSSEYDSGPPSQPSNRRAAPSPPEEDSDSSTSDSSDGAEDLFMNIAEDSAPKPRQLDTIARPERPRSRIARPNARPSLAPALPSPGASSSTTPTTSRIVSTADAKTSAQQQQQQRRASHTPSSSRQLPERPNLAQQTPRTRVPDLSSKPSFSAREDAKLSPREFLAQMGRKTPAPQETFFTPPQRAATYRPSNLTYSSSRDDARPTHVQPVPESASRPDDTESHGSTGPATSVWDELDDLKTRIRRIELGGKIPSTSGAVVSQATADRPRTANTSATTVSSSPNQQRKHGPPSAEMPTEPQASRIHPLLREALTKTRPYVSPAVYRVLESTATEALTLAEMTGSAGPQGTLHSASSILGGASISDRQVRRKADNICRSLTELCLALSDSRPALTSPAIRSATATVSRRPSVQLNAESPTVRQSIEPESNTLPNLGISPSRALERIEARRSTMNTNPPSSITDSNSLPDRQIPSRLSRAGTSMHRTRGSVDESDEDPTLRAPSRAMTDFRALRPEKTRARAGVPGLLRAETIRELAPSPALQSSVLRRPTVTGASMANENSLLYRDRDRSDRRFEYHALTLPQRQSSPGAYDKNNMASIPSRAGAAGGATGGAAGAAAKPSTRLFVNRNPNRNSIGGMPDLRAGMRRARGGSTGE